MPFLKETIESVVNQSYPNVEIIIIDDGSTDGSLEYLKLLNLSNLIIKSNKGKGACAARNYGFELSTGAYIQFLDADDLLSTNKLEKQVKDLEELPKRVSMCSTVHFYNDPSNGKIVDRPFLYSTEQPHQFLLHLYGGNGKDHNMLQTSAWLIPRAIIEKAGPWDETLAKDQDGEFFCRVVVNSEGLIYQPEVLNYYRKHIGGQNIANQKQENHIESQLEALFSKSKQFKGLEETPAYKKAMALQYKLIAINAFPEFKKLSNKAMKLSTEFGDSDFLPVLGGKIIEFIKHEFGWKVAKSLSYWIHK